MARRRENRIAAVLAVEDETRLVEKRRFSR